MENWQQSWKQSILRARSLLASFGKEWKVIPESSEYKNHFGSEERNFQRWLSERMEQSLGNQEITEEEYFDIQDELECHDFSAFAKNHANMIAECGLPIKCYCGG